MYQQYFNQFAGFQKKIADYAVRNFNQTLDQTAKMSKHAIDAVPALNEEVRKNLNESLDFSVNGAKEVASVYESSFAKVESPENFVQGCLKFTEETSKLCLKNASKTQSVVLDAVKKAKGDSPVELGSLFDLWIEALKNGSETFEKSVKEGVKVARQTAEGGAPKK